MGNKVYESSYGDPEESMGNLSLGKRIHKGCVGFSNEEERWFLRGGGEKRKKGRKKRDATVVRLPGM